MVQGLEGSELLNLINRDGRRSRVLEYLPEQRGCFLPDEGSAHPWFVEWLASLHWEISTHYEGCS